MTHILALTEEGKTIYRWDWPDDQDLPTEIADIPVHGTSAIALKSAQIVIRSDGYVLKSAAGITGFTSDPDLLRSLDITEPVHITDDLDPLEVLAREQAMEQHPAVRGRVLRAVDLIDPTPPVLEQAGMDDGQAILTALWVALRKGVEGEVNGELHVEDGDIVQAVGPESTLAIERRDGVMVFTAHAGNLTVISIAPGEDEDEEGTA